MNKMRPARQEQHCAQAEQLTCSVGIERLRGVSREPDPCNACSVNDQGLTREFLRARDGDVPVIVGTECTISKHGLHAQADQQTEQPHGCQESTGKSEADSAQTAENQERAHLR